jgi:hypothetical protein
MLGGSTGMESWWMSFGVCSRALDFATLARRKNYEQILRCSCGERSQASAFLGQPVVRDVSPIPCCRKNGGETHNVVL